MFDRFICWVFWHRWRYRFVSGFLLLNGGWSGGVHVCRRCSTFRRTW